MPVVHLVRHGQASFGAEDYDVLSDHGRAQSVAVAAALTARQLRDPVAVSGTLRRQRDTAALAVPGLEVAVDGRWDEYDHGALLDAYVPEGTAPPADSRGVQDLLDLALTSWVEDETSSWPVFADGAVDALFELGGGLPSGRDAVVFTSGGVIAAVCCSLLGLDATGFVALNRVAVNGAITKLAVGRTGTSLVTFNEHGHLAPADVTFR